MFKVLIHVTIDWFWLLTVSSSRTDSQVSSFSPGASTGLWKLGFKRDCLKRQEVEADLVRPCLEFGTVSLMLYYIVKALKEPVQIPRMRQETLFLLSVCILSCFCCA